MWVNRADAQSLVYLIAYPAVMIGLWTHGFSLLAYLALLVISVGIGVIHHNHTHLRMWKHPWLNEFTDYWLSLLQGHPSFVFYPAHIENHHRHNHGPLDHARTYRFGGDHNHLAGYLFHPFQALRILAPVLARSLRNSRRRRPRLFRAAIGQSLLIAIVWMGLAYLDPMKFLAFVLIPQLHGIHWLLASNYLQHAHADGHSTTNFARNFTGAVNRVWFNIGFHTAHHLHPRAHWSDLRRIHSDIGGEIHPRLVERSLVGYVGRVYLGGLFLPRLRTESLLDLSRLAQARRSNLKACEATQLSKP